MKIFGYCRISRKQQNIERQVRNIKSAYPDAVIVQEAFTGTKIEGRKEFEKLLKAVKAGDCIVFDSVSRMSRNAADGFDLYQSLLKQGVELSFLKERHIDSRVYKEAAEKQISAVQTGDGATDELLAAIAAAINKYMLRLAEQQIRLAFTQAQKEVDDLHQRTREGLATAKLAGKQIGGVPNRKLNVKKAAAAKELILKHSRDFGGSLSDTECMRLAGISRNSFYKYKAQLRSE